MNKPDHTSIKCLVVDDEPLARKLIQDYIKQVEELELVGSCANAIETFSFLRHHEVDLIFLDIHMPQITGIELLKTMRNKPHVILTTAYREYALEAFDLDVADYLLKPITFDRFLRSINKIQQFTRPLIEESKVPSQSVEPYMYFKEGREMVKVNLDQIIYAESDRDFIKVNTPDQQITSKMKISYLEEKLPENDFIRVHRSFIVRFDRVTAFDAHYIHCQDIQIPIGRKYKNETVKALMKNDVRQLD